MDKTEMLLWAAVLLAVLLVVAVIVLVCACDEIGQQKQKVANLNATASTLRGMIADRDKQIADLKAAGNDGCDEWAGKLEMWAAQLNAAAGELREAKDE